MLFEPHFMHLQMIVIEIFWSYVIILTTDSKAVYLFKPTGNTIDRGRKCINIKAGSLFSWCNTWYNDFSPKGGAVVSMIYHFRIFYLFPFIWFIHVWIIYRDMIDKFKSFPILCENFIWIWPLGGAKAVSSQIFYLLSGAIQWLC